MFESEKNVNVIQYFFMSNKKIMKLKKLPIDRLRISFKKMKFKHLVDEKFFFLIQTQFAMKAFLFFLKL